MTTLASKKLEDLHDLYHEVMRSSMSSEGNSILFGHFGDFNASKNDSVLKLIEASLIDSGVKRQTAKRFCSTLIEVLQNISIHSAKDQNGRMHAYLVLTQKDDGFGIYSGNLILRTEMAGFSGKLSQISGMDKDALRKLYIETLCSDEMSSKGGAGLGLLTIAKRSSDPLDYHLNELDGIFGYIQMHSSISEE
jgi:hypothetical protein